MAEEALIIINGQTLTSAQSRTVRFAVEVFTLSLLDDEPSAAALRPRSDHDHLGRLAEIIAIISRNAQNPGAAVSGTELSTEGY